MRADASVSESLAAVELQGDGYIVIFLNINKKNTSSNFTK